MQFRQFVAEPVSVGGKPRIPLQRPHSIIAFVVCGIVSANDMLLPAFRVRLLDMRHKRNDDVPAFLGSQRLPYPVVGAEPHNARIRVPAYRPAVAVGLVIGGDAHRQHALCLFEISPFLRKPPCERAFRRLGPPVLHLLYRRKARRHVRSGGRLDFPERDRTRFAAFGIYGMGIRPLQQTVQIRLCLSVRIRLDLLPGVGIEKHSRMPFAHPRNPLPV